ncbi:uncharacterized protein LOC129803958 isoform X2 [Phlebotomus papatasi]|uniref:uncharacterized protein LOC129803958 isoform X2 n=1 Tax=Phlebotomus papatasi TaxID=29031 RepID=UPI0024843C7B|nr:uncharacterized protein LOC129803958 isoform X2 [Phlebotomus papatasi]
MAILHSCCLWKSVRKGSYASVIYTLIYFSASCIFAADYLHDERRYLTGEVERPSGDSILEKGEISPTSVIFNILLLICASCGVISSILVIVGLRTNQRELLLPWIFVMIADILVAFAHFVHLVILETLDFQPLTATLFTIDFFLMCLNVYSLLCVISQYQEFKEGRGIAETPKNIYGPYQNVRYIPPTPSSSCPNSQRPNSHRHLTSPTICPHTNCTIIPEETQLNGSLGVIHISSPFHQRTKKQSKRHVQFPDDAKCCSESSALSDANGNGHTLVIDTLPEYEEILTWQENPQQQQQCENY